MIHTYLYEFDLLLARLVDGSADVHVGLNRQYLDLCQVVDFGAVERPLNLRKKSSALLLSEQVHSVRVLAYVVEDTVARKTPAMLGALVLPSI